MSNRTAADAAQRRALELREVELGPMEDTAQLIPANRAGARNRFMGGRGSHHKHRRRHRHKHSSHSGDDSVSGDESASDGSGGDKATEKAVEQQTNNVAKLVMIDRDMLQAVVDSNRTVRNMIIAMTTGIALLVIGFVATAILLSQDSTIVEDAINAMYDTRVFEAVKNASELWLYEIEPEVRESLYVAKDVLQGLREAQVHDVLVRTSNAILRLDEYVGNLTTAGLEISIGAP